MPTSKVRTGIAALAAMGCLWACREVHMAKREAKETFKTDKEWKETLTPEQYHILRGKGTENAFTGQYYAFKGTGTYLCAACGHPLFSSQKKYDSGTGWPSFWEPLRETAVARAPDHSLGRERTEVLCPVCGGHLGHVFEDGPPPSGLRYCINSAALRFAVQ